MVGAITRAVSYIVAALGGVLSIYLGYRLYVHGIESSVSGSASHAGWKGTLRASGPGVFLVLFGAAILGSIVFSRASFSSEERVENGAIASSLLVPSVRASTLGSPSPSQQQTAGQKGKAAKDCIVARRVTKRNVSFVDGGPLSRARLRAATATSLQLVEEARAKEAGLDRLRALAHAKETLEALSDELSDD